MKTQEHYTKIPTLDIGPYLNGEEGALEELGAKVAHIQENIGFLMLVNHGLDLATLNGVYDKLKAFFALPMEVKLKYRINELSLGFIPPKSTMYVSSKINKNTKKDLNETLTLALERPSDHPWVKDKMRFVGPNQWPAEIEGLQEAICAYQNEVLKLGRKILPIYAVALDQPPAFFDEFFTDPVMWSRNAHYPAVEAEDNQFGIAPHSDYSCITILNQGASPGLEFLMPSGEWVAAPMLPGHFLINTGQFLTRWSNDMIPATPHRVINSTGDLRHSVAFLTATRSDVLIECLPSCQSPDNPAKYPPITYADHIAEINKKTYDIPGMNETAAE